MMNKTPKVIGTDVDPQTRCAHYNSEIDVVAIKFKCCGQWFPCFKCHAEQTNHSPEVWSVRERDTLAILCGVCRHQLTITEYLESSSICPKCRSQFNPACANHYDLYFEIAG
ncbi:MAG: CHY zinc finger protein [Acidobacteriota bacterium]